ncbi:Bardet-Biedl syndrome 12 protein, partial [Alligator mississippiensis]|uniref:Bardet-Biedl syndrome 12 protein n=1 Tax=Alligator mississippiensis TaxID=8496 RepID=UPI0003D0C0E4
LVVMAFRNVNRRRHVGLQQLSSLASIGRTLLGPLKSYKFIVNESTNESVLACSVVRLLESLDLTSAVGQLLNETIQAQSKEYKTGTTTLLFLAGAWSSAVLECLQQNVPVPVIVSVMSEGLNSCSERVKCLPVSVHDLYEGLDSVPIQSNFSSARPQIFENKTPSAGSNSFLNPFMHFHKDVPVTEEECVPEGPCSHQANTCDLHNRCLSSPTYATGHQMHSAVGPVGDKTMLSIPGSSSITSSCNKKRLTHSRHFNAVGKKGSLLHVGSFQGNPIGPSTHHYECKDFGQLAMALSHGNQASMKLVQDIVRCQQWKTNPTGLSQFNIEEIVTCCLPGVPESYSCICPGYVTSVSPEKAAVTKQLQGRLLQMLLIDGDLTEKYRHLGFNRPTNVKTVSESLGVQESSSGCSWTSRMLDILMQSEVNLILVKGNVCEHLMERCILNNILIINPVTQNVLYAFARVTGAKPVTYLTQVNSQCVGGGVGVDFWRTGELSTEELESRMLISIKAEGSTLVTAVLSSTVISKMQVIDDQFWTCAYRLQHALTDGKVFPGGGAVELFCLSHVQKLVDQALNQGNKNSAGEFHSAPCWMAESLAEFKPLVLKALASGWHKYLSTVMCNSANYTSEFEASISIKQHLKKMTGCGSPSAYILQEFNLREVVGKVGPDPLTKCMEFVQVYDNVTAKLEAWRRALDLVLLVLQTDSEIITGPKRNELLSSPVSSEFIFI